MVAIVSMARVCAIRPELARAAFKRVGFETASLTVRSRQNPKSHVRPPVRSGSVGVLGNPKRRPGSDFPYPAAAVSDCGMSVSGAERRRSCAGIGWLMK